MAMRSESTAARSSRSLAVSGQVPRATSTVNTSTATPSSPLTLAARTSMPLRARAPATEEKSPRRSGAATMTWGGWSDTDGSPVWRTSSIELLVGRQDGVRARPARSRPGARGRSRSTRSATRPAFQGPQAEGPVARLSASVERGEEVEGQPVAGGAGDAGDGGRVVEVAPGGRVGQQQVVAHQVDEDRDVGGREAHAGRDALDDLHADGRVVAGEALADVVQRVCRSSSRSGRSTVSVSSAASAAASRRCRSTVIGVVGVALRLVAHGGPLRDEADEQAVLVERLHLVDGGRAEAEQRDQRLEGLGRPGVARRGHAIGQAVERALGDRVDRARPPWRPGAAAVRRRRRRARAA